MEQEGFLGGCGCPMRSDAREMFIVSCRLSEPESWADCSGGLWTPPPPVFYLRGQLMSGECVWHWMGPGAVLHLRQWSALMPRGPTVYGPWLICSPHGYSLSIPRRNSGEENGVKFSKVWFHMPTLAAPREPKARGFQVQGQPGKLSQNL